MVVCCFVLFVATLSDFGLLFYKIEALIELRKMLIRKKHSSVLDDLDDLDDLDNLDDLDEKKFSSMYHLDENIII